MCARAHVYVCMCVCVYVCVCVCVFHGFSFTRKDPSQSGTEQTENEATVEEN